MTFHCYASLTLSVNIVFLLLEVKIASFRGRPLKGRTIGLPPNCKGKSMHIYVFFYPSYLLISLLLFLCFDLMFVIDYNVEKDIASLI